MSVASSNGVTAVPWRLAIVHETRFDYEGPTLTSYNEARLTPLTTARQSVTDASLDISPRPGVVHRYWDYWGTLVSAFDLSEPHTGLEVVSRSTVETNEALPAPDTVDWAELTSSARTDAYAELLAVTPRTLVDAETVAALAADARDVTPAAAAQAIADRVRDNVEYVPGSTEVQTGAQEAWNQRAGVCQDIAHLTIGVLRAVGIPARYVSGYLHPDEDAPIGQESSGQSHAWVEWWCGAWWGYDPTNGVAAGYGHVIVGRGRDYTDVPPLKGVYSGPPSTHVDVGVSVTPLVLKLPELRCRRKVLPMRVVRWLSAALLAVATLTVPVAAHATPSAPSAPYTALTMNVTPASFDPSPGDSGASTYADDQVVVSSFFPTFVDIDGGTDPTGDTGIGFVLSPRTGGTLTVGTLPIAYNANNQAGGLTLSIAHGACQASTGNVVISAISFTDGAHQLTADYDVTCNGQRYQGAARISSPQGYDGADLTPGTIPYGNVDVGQTRDTTFSFSPRGTTAPVTLGVVALSSATTASFETTADTCSHATLAYGAACTVTVRTAPLEAGAQSLVVTFPTTAGASYASAISLTAVDPVTGTYYPVDPQRVLDTRVGIGTRRAPLGAGQTIDFYPGVGQGDQKASAVVLNLTVTTPSTSGYLTLYPSGTTRPRTSSINYTRAWTGANLVTVPIDAAGRVAVFNSAGTTAVIADLVGWYSAPDPDASAPRGGGYHTTQVQRIFDTRTAGTGKLPGGYYVDIPVRYQGDGGHIAALSVAVTAANMTGTGYLTTWNGYYDAPRTSTLNYTKASGVVTNAAVVPTSYCPPGAACNANAYIAIQNQGATPVDVIVDISGFYDDGDLPADVRFHALPSPTRIIDTRSNLGTGRFGTNDTHTVAAPTSVAGIDTIALDANITAAVPTQRTYLTVWPKFDNYPRPVAAALNPLRGQTVAGHVVAEVGYGNLFNIYNFTGATDVVMDVGGTFEAFPPTPPGAAGKRATPRAVAVPGANLAAAKPVLHRG